MIVGLTGGIGTGKSTVCAIFKRLGVPIINADTIARDIVDTDKTVLQTIIKKFGHDFLTSDHKLDRKKLKQQIFVVTEDRIWLERFLHPLIAKEIIQQTKNITYPYCIVEIPLLIEANMQNLVDRILTVDCPEDMQLKQAMQRDQHTAEEIKAIIAAQITRAERLNATNDIIENNGDMPTLIKRVEQLHEMYLGLAM